MYHIPERARTLMRIYQLYYHMLSRRAMSHLSAELSTLRVRFAIVIVRSYYKGILGRAWL